MGTRNTRDAIVEGALELFNENTVAAVSTNHIAQAIGISPGNLYYHYRNKEEIVRAVFDRMVGDWDTVWQLPPGRAPTARDLARTLERTFELHWRYRFFQRELLALLTRDPQLRDRYRAVYRQRLEEFAVFAESLAAAGAIRSPIEPGFTGLLEGLWIIGEHWMGHLEIVGDPDDPAQVRRGVQVIVAVLRPHLRDESFADCGQEGPTP